MTSEGSNHGKSILLVDDDEDFRYQQRIQLEKVGYKVVEAESGDEAELRFAEAPFDLAVVDLMLEQPDRGFTLCYHMKKKNADFPIVMVTSVASDAGIDFDAATEEERSWLKADVVLQKPIRFEQLQGEIEALLSD